MAAAAPAAVAAVAVAAAAPAAAPAAPAPARRVDHIEGAVDAIFDLFKSKGWTKLPAATMLERDEEATKVMTQMFLPDTIKRSQLATQFRRWKALGQPAAMAASSASDEFVRAIVNSRVGARGGIDAILQRAFDTVADSSLVRDRDEFMTSLFDDLRKNDSFCGDCTDRLEELKRIFVEHFARVATKVSSNSVLFEKEVYHTQQIRKLEWERKAYVTSIFGQWCAAMPTSALGAESLAHLQGMMWLTIDQAICMQFRSLFGPSAGLPDLAIPKFPQKSTEIFDSVDSVVYYIAGALCSALMKNSERCRKTDRTRASLFGTFVGAHTKAGESREKRPAHWFG